MKFVWLTAFILSTQLTALAQPAAVLFEEDIARAVKTFNKNVQIYHYFYAPSVDSNDPQWPKKAHDSLQKNQSRLDWTNYYLSARAGAFWDMSDHNTQFTNAGPGVYFALDPDSSKEFGETAVVMNVPQGTKFISVFKPITLRRQTLSALVRENYVSSSQMKAGSSRMGLEQGFSGNSLRYMVLPENIKMRMLIAEVLTKLEIRFIEYHYKSHLAGFCKIANQSAFVFIGKNPLQAKPEDYLYANQPAAGIEPVYQNLPLFTGYKLEEQSESEIYLTQLLSRFRYVLAQIRIRGTRAAGTLINENLSPTETDRLIELSYECTRRHQ